MSGRETKMTSIRAESWRSNITPLTDRSKQWLCNQEECQTKNFATHFACRLCNFPRKGTSMPVDDARRRDWYCQEAQCFEFNFASRTTCRKCGISAQRFTEDRQIALRTET